MRGDLLDPLALHKGVSYDYASGHYPSKGVE